MKITRRNFVQSLGTIAAITFSGAGINSAFGLTTVNRDGFAVPSTSGLFAISEGELGKFLGQSFVAVSSEGKSIEVILTEVNGVGRTANLKRGYTGNCFSAIFKCVGDESLDQGVYEMKASGLDAFSALLVPTGRLRREYELLVNNISR